MTKSRTHVELAQSGDNECKVRAPSDGEPVEGADKRLKLALNLFVREMRKGVGLWANASAAGEDDAVGPTRGADELGGGANLSKWTLSGRPLYSYLTDPNAESRLDSVWCLEENTVCDMFLGRPGVARSLVWTAPARPTWEAS